MPNKMMRRLFANRDNTLVRGAARAARSVLKCYENLSYDFDTNGERAVLNKLAACGFKTVFDVGANVGEYASMLATTFPQARVHAFEVVPATFAALERVAATAPAIEANNVGLSDEAGELDIKWCPDASGVSSMFDYPHKQEGTWVKCPVTTGDTYCDERGISSIDFLKIDVEGAEHLVLRGLRERLQAGRIKVIQFEYGYVNILSRFLLRDFYGLLDGFGFTVGKVYPRRVEFRPYRLQDEDFWGPNYVAVRREHTDLVRLLSRG